MSGSLIGLFVWLVAANLAAVLPSRDNHWRRAYALIATGLPLMVWIFWQNPLWVGILAMVAGLSMLRWPVIYLVRWLRR